MTLTFVYVGQISAAPFNITTILTISAHDLEFLKCDHDCICSSSAVYYVIFRLPARRPSLAQLSVVSGDIVLVAGDLLHDSITPENLSAIRAEVANYPQVRVSVCLPSFLLPLLTVYDCQVFASYFRSPPAIVVTLFLSQVTLVVYRNGGGEHTIALGGYEVPARRFWMKYARWAGVHYVNTRDGCVHTPGRDVSCFLFAVFLTLCVCVLSYID